MNQRTRAFVLGLGIFAGAAEYQLTNPKMYAVAGAAGLGVAIGSKDLRTGVLAGAIAAVGIIGYTAMDNVEEVLDQAINEGIL